MRSGPRQESKIKRTPTVSDEIALVLTSAALSAWIGLLVWASLSSHLPSVPRVFAWDKLQHFSAYAILMFLSGHFFRLLFKKRFQGWIIGFIFTVGFGLVMEIGQETLTISRYADWQDFLANLLGAGVILAFTLINKEKNHK